MFVARCPLESVRGEEYGTGSVAQADRSLIGSLAAIDTDLASES
jgi:hypothetical protein